MRSAATLALLLASASLAAAHYGGLNAEGCHTKRNNDRLAARTLG
jgi:hypothetical protein